jgi:hypothetical protein
VTCRRNDTGKHRHCRLKPEALVRQEGLGSVESRDDHHHGWNSALNKLVAYLKASG